MLSLVFTFTYAALAAKSKRAEKLLMPMLDILQSVPILGFISVTVVFFMSLVPGRVLGAEFAAIFAIFTSQAWNMAFSFYQSLRTVPGELGEAARMYHLSPWMRFWQLEVPFAMPQLVWNMMMSMSGGWFFVVASEAITVGNTTVTLPGIGSYIALAIEQRNLRRGGLGDPAMLVVILIYDQLLFRPLVAWVGALPIRAGGRRATARILGARRCCAARGCRRTLGDRLSLVLAALVASRAAARPAADAARPDRRRSLAPLRRAGAALIVVVALIALWQIVQLHRRRASTLAEVGKALRARRCHPRARGRADRGGSADLGADRGLDRAAAAPGPSSSRSFNSWRRFRRICCSRSWSSRSSRCSSTPTSGSAR